MSDVKMDKRPYHSPLRQEQAQATRTRIMDSALELFSAQGYGSTSIAAIAREAGVVPETIYAAFGSKRGIIDGLIDRAVPEQTVARIHAAWEAAAGSPADQLRAVAKAGRGFWELNERLVSVMRRGTGDAEIGDIWVQRAQDRRQLIGSLLAGWEPDVFAADLTPIEAGDIAWSIASDECFHGLVVDRGWTADRWEAWVGGTLIRLLLADPV
jgi:AcrR family transcriptional regulator